MAGFAKAFDAVTDAASTAWGFAMHFSNSSPDQPKVDVSGDRSLQTLDLHPSRRNPLEDSLNGMFAGMVKSGETILENWMKRDGEDVEVFEQFCLLASELVSNTAFGKNCMEANNKSPHMGWVVKKNDAFESKKHEQSKTLEELFRKGFPGKPFATNQESEKNNKYSNEEIAHECMAFCFVGCTATASILGWMVHMLSRDKNLQERARKEVIEIFGCEYINPEGIEKLTVIDKILEDCARLYPLVPFKLKVSNGNAEEQPDGDKRNPTVFHFGHGRGAWLGWNFAKLEAKVVLSMILRRFVFTLSPAYNHSPVRGFTVTPKHGIRVILQVRREESKTVKIIKTVGIVAGVAAAAWGISKLLGPDEPVPKPEEGKKVKMMKNPGRPHELIARSPFEETPAQRFKRNRELAKAEKLAKRALGIK
ncbi:hypothetical protein DM860_008288 [Cuscuta australis]|uniref:Uncharacterized protein n=1 Tax=Cuscuta australis TaxID=267555 RepID=A0A328D6R2_9ASTE|nr:hypothetical protein DM860_008288 [Cuscuta australis]